MSIKTTRQVIVDALEGIGPGVAVSGHDVSATSVGATVEVLGPVSFNYSESVNGKRFDYRLTVVASIPATGSVANAQAQLDDLTDPTNTKSVFRLLHAVTLSDPLKQLRVVEAERPLTPDAEGRWVALIEIQCVEVYTT